MFLMWKSWFHIPRASFKRLFPSYFCRSELWMLRWRWRWQNKTSKVKWTTLNVSANSLQIKNTHFISRLLFVKLWQRINGLIRVKHLSSEYAHPISVCVCVWGRSDVCIKWGLLVMLILWKWGLRLQIWFIKRFSFQGKTREQSGSWAEAFHIELSATWRLVSVHQVVSWQIHRGMVDGVDEAGLHHGVVGVLHRNSCVDHIHLDRTETLEKAPQ